MKLIKTIDDIELIFEIKKQTSVIKQETILFEIINSLNGFKFINKNQPFNELVKEQQKYSAYALVEFDACLFDELKFICKAVFNFLKETNQLKNYSIEQITFGLNDNNKIIIYGTEQFSIYDEHGYKVKHTDKIVFLQ